MLLLSVLPTPTWAALQPLRIFATKLVASQRGSALHSTVLGNIAVSPLAPTSTHASGAKEENLTLSSCVESKMTDKGRLIHHLSAPYDEKSINENICNENTSVQYASIQDAITIIQQLGPHCYMAKSDIKSAYRLIPVSPADYPKLGLKFDGFYYFDKCLTQGCASSCKTSEMFSTALEWILKKKYGVKYCLHVLDDFLFLGKSYEEYTKYLSAWESLCKVLSVPLAAGKTMGPLTNIIFLGIELCSENMLAKLPPDKLSS